MKRFLISWAIAVPLGIGLSWLVADDPTWAGLTISFLIGWIVNAEVREAMKS